MPTMFDCQSRRGAPMQGHKPHAETPNTDKAVPVGDNGNQHQGLAAFCSRWPHTLATLILTIAGWTALFGAAFAGWPGDTGEGGGCEESYLEDPGCFCEEIVGSKMIKQTSNTWSNIVYAASALVCAICSDAKLPLSWWSSNNNLMTEQPYFIMTFCLLLTNISYCSGFMHAGWRVWGGKLDGLSIQYYFIWLGGFTLARFWLMWHGWTKESVETAAKAHVIGCAIPSITLTTLLFTTGVPSIVTEVIYYSVGIVFILELAVHYTYQFCKGKHRFSQAWLGYLAAVMFVAGFVMQSLSKSGSKMCDPQSLFQGHALWHVLSGLASAVLFFFYLTEKFTKQRRSARYQSETILASQNFIQESLSTEKNRAIFDKIDKSSDGTLKFGELKAFMGDKIEGKILGDIWGVINTDGSKTMDFTEFCLFMEEVKTFYGGDEV